MTAMHSTHAPPAPTSLSLSTGGIETTKKMLSALADQRYHLELMEPWIRRKAPHRMREFDEHRIGVEYTDRVEQLWRTQGRQVLSFHPGLANEVRLAKSSKIVPEVFAALPYINPMIVFPEPVDVPSWNNHPERMRVLGAMVHGRASHRTVTGIDEIPALLGSTHDVNYERLGLVIVTEVLDHLTGELKTYEFNRTSTSGRVPATLAEMVENAVASYGWANTLGSDISAQVSNDGESKLRVPDQDAQRAFMQSMYALVLGTLMYLCSTVLDAQPVPKSRIRRAWGQTRQVPNLINVGWRIGPALSTARAAYRDKEGSALPGRTLPPHQRCAHFKTVWTGPGRTIPKTAFVAPYWVHKDQMHLVDTKTVRPVK